MKMLLWLLVWSLFSCGDAPQERITIGTNVWPGYEPLYLAREKAYFADLNVKIVEYRSASQVIDGLSSGMLDMAGLTLDEAIKVSADGTPLKIILIFDISQGADALVARAEYNTIDKLKGKRIGIERSALGAYFFQRFLDENQLMRSDFTIVGLDIEHQLQAMTRQQVEAVVTFEPVKSKLLRQGGNVLFDSLDLPNEIIDVLVITEPAYQRLGEQTIQQFVNQYWQAAIAFIDSPSSYLPIFNKRLQLSLPELQQTFTQIHMPDIPEQLMIMAKLGEGQETVNKYNNILAEKGFIEQKCDCTELFEPRFIKAVE